MTAAVGEVVRVADSVHVVGVVLSGGRSRRMGTDKALIDLGGRYMVQDAVTALTDVGVNEVLLIGGANSWPEEALTAVTSMAAVPVATVDDLYPGEGPLGGVLTAFRALEAGRDASVIVVVPCDVPEPDTDRLLTTVMATVITTGTQTGTETGTETNTQIGTAATGENAVDGATISVNGQVMAVVGCYRVSMVDEVARRFAAGERRVRSLVECGTVVVVELPERRAPKDLDTPQDLAEWAAGRSGKT
jgi:molybdopterin-guanine dinucleotide biosynthesis protein A